MTKKMGRIIVCSICDITLRLVESVPTLVGEFRPEIARLIEGMLTFSEMKPREVLKLGTGPTYIIL